MSSIPCPLFTHAQHHPNDLAVLSDTDPLSYQDLHERVHTLSLFLKRQGVKSGTRVSFLGTSSLASIILFLAILRTGAIVCPLNLKTPERQICNRLNALKSSHFFISEELPWNIPTPSSDCPHLLLSSLATFLFTSGSSADPKIACHSLGNHYYSALQMLDALCLKQGSLYLLSLPLFHVSGIAILFRTLFARATLALSSFPLHTALSMYPISHLSVVPTQLFRLLEHVKSPPPSLRKIVVGGDAISSSLLEKGAHWPLLPSYGMTEMSSTISLGKVLPCSEVKISQGEIFVRGKTRFQGYLSPITGELEPLDPEDWFATKDLGSLSCGILTVTGRKDRQFISRGENIQPEEIERALLSLPGIVKARVEPKQDPELGHVPCAYIAGRSYSVSDIQRHLSSLLLPFKLPVEVHPWQGSLRKDFS